MSWQPDPYSFTVDAFSISWSEYTNVYAFPPFSLVGPVLTKLRQDKVTGIIVIPYWTTQYWFPMMLEMLTEHPLLLPNQKDTIQLPFRKDAIHPMYPKMRMLAVRLSGLDSEVLDYQDVESIILSSWRQTTRTRYESILRRWKAFCVKGKIIPIIQL